MQLKTTTGYAILVLFYLYQKRGQVIGSEELTGAAAVSPNYLHTVISRLKGAGCVETMRGLFGGYLDNGDKLSNSKYGACAVSRFYAFAQETWDAMLKKMRLKAPAQDPDRDKLEHIFRD